MGQLSLRRIKHARMVHYTLNVQVYREAFKSFVFSSTKVFFHNTSKMGKKLLWLYDINRVACLATHKLEYTCNYMMSGSVHQPCYILCMHCKKCKSVMLYFGYVLIPISFPIPGKIKSVIPVPIPNNDYP